MATLEAVSSLEEVVEFLASAPTQEQILEFHASEALQTRLAYLLDQNRNGLLTDSERAEMDEMSQTNHFIILLKARVRKKMMSNDLHS